MGALEGNLFTGGLKKISTAIKRLVLIKSPVLCLSETDLLVHERTSKKQFTMAPKKKKNSLKRKQGYSLSVYGLTIWLLYAFLRIPVKNIYYFR